MKRLLYLFSLVVLTAGLNSCKKDSDPQPDPVVGSWKLDRIRTAGFSGAFASFNGDNDPALFDYQDSFTVKTDKTFAGTVRTSGRVVDYNGNWEFSGTQLSLKNDQGAEDRYTLDATKTPAQLLSETIATSDSLRNPTTNKIEVVNYSLQLVYTKQ
ncbi:lipocalin family protein [Larkinella soli]|uniref:lipocalin family protein n=1 Tax=Larkinella soli TaxID=1770527 RepID=UPI000FFC9DD0|nr:lipocalin family protein [Larkinella soli]